MAQTKARLFGLASFVNQFPDHRFSFPGVVQQPAMPWRKCVFFFLTIWGWEF